jgi:hypothetical protein
VVKGKYINEEARKAYKKAEKKVKPKAEGPLHLYKEDNIAGIKTDMLNMMEEIDKIKMSVRVLATRLNRVDGMGK